MEWNQYNTENINSKYLFKFLSEKNLKKFLKTGNIWFSRSDKFGDKMECVLIKDLLQTVPDFKKIEARKRKHLISCFHEGNKETLAFWDTYSKTEEDRRKYALRFKRKELINLIESNSDKITLQNNFSLTKILDSIPKSLIHGKVKYKNLIGANRTNLQDKIVKYPAFRKEYVFAYEREYRFDIILNNEFKGLGHNYNIGKPKEINFSILVNPLLENKEYVKCVNNIKSSEFERKYKMSTLTKWLKPELWKF